MGIMGIVLITLRVKYLISYTLLSTNLRNYYPYPKQIVLGPWALRVMGNAGFLASTVGVARSLVGRRKAVRRLGFTTPIGSIMVP